jgi:hypothetical protein
MFNKVMFNKVMPPLGFGIGFASGIAYTHNRNIPLKDKFFITTFGTITGTSIGIILEIVWPIIIPTTILFIPYAIYDKYFNTHIKIKDDDF